ncbi:hypothetical protein [Cupriavidus sp. D39]|nr:hypothetical protein [Cupriavidus sp. D39]MCY0858778.1 hypothetical protein [Cupriavidus sp. D39]
MRKVIDLLTNPRPNDSIQLKGATEGSVARTSASTALSIATTTPTFMST